MDVTELRKRFLVEFVSNRYLYHDEDARRIRESDYWVKRFILHKNQGSNSGFYHMKDTLKWKKSSGIRDFNPIDIPREVYELSPIFSYLPDGSGTVPIYVRCKMVVKIPVLEERMQQYLAYILDKIDNEVRKPYGWSVIFDCTDAGIENANFDLMFYAMNILGKYFPMQPKYIATYGIPWMLKPFVKMGLSLVPEEAKKLIKFVDNIDQLQNDFGFKLENIPDFMGGTATKDYRNTPETAQNYIEVGKRILKMNEQEIKQMMEPLAHLIASVEKKNDSNDGKSLSFIEEFD